MGIFKNIFTSLVKIDRDQALNVMLENEYSIYCAVREKWTTGERNAENASIREWEYANKPIKSD